MSQRHLIARRVSSAAPVAAPSTRMATRHPAWAPILIAILLALSAFTARAAFSPTTAHADEAPVTMSDPVIDAVPSELQLLVEQTSAAYNEAVAAREALEGQVGDCEARIAELEGQLPAAQDRAADALITLYKMHQSGAGLMELLLSADSFNEFITTIQYLNSINQHNVEQLEELYALCAQIDAEKAALQTALEEARAQEALAQEALAQAQAAREEAQRRAAEEAARQRAAAEAAARAAAEQAAQAAGNDGAPAESDGSGADFGSAGSGDAPEGSDGGSSWDDGGAADESGSWDDGSWDDSDSWDDGGIDWTDERSVFIAEWGARIDAYLAGFPLAGYGSVFAAAAWDYGVDPRWSPAIAFVESTAGTYCFRPHNAWGWGSVSWDSWEEAIYGHVGGLARGYGYTITYEAALRYCPSNADYWYTKVSDQMSRI